MLLATPIPIQQWKLLPPAKYRASVEPSFRSPQDRGFAFVLTTWTMTPAQFAPTYADTSTFCQVPAEPGVTSTGVTGVMAIA